MTVSPPKDRLAKDRSITVEGCSKGEKNEDCAGCRGCVNDEVCEPEDSRETWFSTGVSMGETSGLGKVGDVTEDLVVCPGGDVGIGGVGSRCGGAGMIVSSTVVDMLSRKPGERGESASAGSAGACSSCSCPGVSLSTSSACLASSGSSGKSPESWAPEAGISLKAGESSVGVVS